MRRALISIVVCACSRAPTTQLPHATTVMARPRALAVPNETMEFRVRFRGITVGSVQTAIGRPGWVDGHRAIIVRSRGHGDGLVSIFGDLVWELTSTIDLDRGTPIRDREEAWIEFAGKKDHENDEHTWRDGEARHDVHSAIAVLRGWHGAHDETTDVEVRVGGGRFTITVWDAAHEFLAAAEKPAVRYDGVVDRGFHFAIWLSDDSARVPLAFRCDTELGTLTVDLVDYEITDLPGFAGDG